MQKIETYVSILNIMSASILGPFWQKLEYKISVKIIWPTVTSCKKSEKPNASICNKTWKTHFRFHLVQKP